MSKSSLPNCNLSIPPMMDRDRSSNSSMVSGSSNQKSSAKSSQKQITVMLMTISISFVLLSFPYSAFELMRKLDLVQFAWLRTRQANRLVLLLLDIHHATNFFLYCLTGQKFRAELKEMFLNALRCPNGNNSANNTPSIRLNNNNHTL